MLRTNFPNCISRSSLFRCAAKGCPALLRLSVVKAGMRFRTAPSIASLLYSVQALDMLGLRSLGRRRIQMGLRSESALGVPTLRGFGFLKRGKAPFPSRDNL